MSRKVFVLDNKLTITDDEIEGILERTVTKQIPWEEGLCHNYEVRRGSGSGIVSHTLTQLLWQVMNHSLNYLIQKTIIG